LHDPDMLDNSHAKSIGLLLSGGVDSAVLLGQLLDGGHQVVPFYVKTGCVWQAEELAAVDQFVARIARPGLMPLVQLEMPLGDLYGSHWSMTGAQVPDDHTPDEAVFLPGRNPLLLIKPALWCLTHGIGQLALATLALNPFHDATPEFFARFEAMLAMAMDARLEIVRPFAGLTKRDVLARGRELPLGLTFSCLSPVGRLHCGRCNKCAERRQAFFEIGLADDTVYGGPRRAASGTA
jgi:7-cyano-7-deazaguanine synthase